MKSPARPSLLVALGWTLASFVFAALTYLTVAEIVGNLPSERREAKRTNGAIYNACEVDSGLPGCRKTGGAR